MTEEIQDVNQEASQAEVDASTTEMEQEQTDSEVVQTPESDGKDYKKIAENLSKALREERAKSKQPMQSQPAPQSEDDTVKRFLRTEADARIAVKLQTDPSFKDRVEIVQSYVEQGFDIDMADKLAKADIMDQILTDKSEPAQPNIPKQIQPTAIPEQKVVRQTGNVLTDLQKGSLKVEIEGISNADMQDVIRRNFPELG